MGSSQIGGDDGNRFHENISTCKVGGEYQLKHKFQYEGCRYWGAVWMLGSRWTVCNWSLVRDHEPDRFTSSIKDQHSTCFARVQLLNGPLLCEYVK